MKRLKKNVKIDSLLKKENFLKRRKGKNRDH